MHDIYGIKTLGEAGRFAVLELKTSEDRGVQLLLVSMSNTWILANPVVYRDAEGLKVVSAKSRVQLSIWDDGDGGFIPTLMVGFERQVFEGENEFPVFESVGEILPMTHEELGFISGFFSGL